MSNCPLGDRGTAESVPTHIVNAQVSPGLVSGVLVPNGLEIVWRGERYQVTYPDHIWEQFPDKLKSVLLDNVTYACSMHLPLVITNLSTLKYTTARPLFEPYFFQNFVRDVPSCTDVDGVSCAEAYQRFLAVRVEFGSDRIRDGRMDSFQVAEKAIVAMSFGKDSLLTFAIAEELGLDPEMIFIHEPSMTYERAHKSALAGEFEKQFGKSLHILEHSTGLLRDYNHLGVPKSEFGWGLQSTEYALLMLPFAYHFRARYLFFGNEQSAGMVYLDDSGKWCIYPCYDQTHIWSCHLDQMTAALSAGQIRTGSIIEPIMDMMIQRMLVTRYPDYARFQMSCFTEDAAGEAYRWCQQCSVCAKMYLLCAGGGVNPAAIGFTERMLSERYRFLYPLLGGDSNFSYLRSALARDEQLYAFYCASLLGFSDDLISSFRASPLFSEADQRFEELHTVFCSAYDPISTPLELRSRLLTIVNEELGAFQQLISVKRRPKK